MDVFSDYLATSQTRKRGRGEEKETVSAAQNNDNYIKARIDKTQQNIRCSLSGEKDETINLKISE